MMRRTAYAYERLGCIKRALPTVTASHFGTHLQPLTGSVTLLVLMSEVLLLFLVEVWGGARTGRCRQVLFTAGGRNSVGDSSATFTYFLLLGDIIF